MVIRDRLGLGGGEIDGQASVRAAGQPHDIPRNHRAHPRGEGGSMIISHRKRRQASAIPPITPPMAAASRNSAFIRRQERREGSGRG